jgi:hypothetical protein
VCTVNDFISRQGRLLLAKNHRSISCTLVKFSLAPVHANKFSLSQSWHEKLWNKASWQGKKINFLPYTQANKTCEGKIALSDRWVNMLDTDNV